MKIMVFETETRHDSEKANFCAVPYRFGGTFFEFVFDYIEETRCFLEEPYELVDTCIESNHAFAVWKWRGTDHQQTIDIVAIDD